MSERPEGDAPMWVRCWMCPDRCPMGDCQRDNLKTADYEVIALERLLYEHREGALTCYDHPSEPGRRVWCCACGAHDLTVPWRRHIAEQVALARPIPSASTADGA